MIKKISIVLLGFTFILVLTGCEAFKKPQPEDEIVEVDDIVVDSAHTAENSGEKSAEKKESVPNTNGSSGKEDGTIEEKTKTDVKTEKATKGIPKSEVKTFGITAKQFEFSPSSITVNEGDTVRISITTQDVTHGFVIPDFGINKMINPGATVIVEFVADKKGTFPFRCSIYCGDGHAEMTGSLTVK